MTRAHALSVLTAVVLGLAGCSAGSRASGGPDGDIGGMGSDAGRVPSDGAVSSFDASGAVPDLGTHPTTVTPEGSGTATDVRGYAGSELDSCYDGADNNMDGRADCQDPGCGRLASCCPAAGTSCCDARAAVALPAFASCTGSLVGCALPGVHLFGTGLPHADGSGLYPGGDHTNEGGLVVDAALDRTRATFVRATLALPPATECATGCIESVAIGLLEDATLGATSSVRPIVALVASGSLEEILLVSGDVTLGAVPVPTADGAPFSVTLTLSASGTVVADVAGMQLTATVPVPAAPLHLAVYGHNENRSGVPSSRVVAITLEQAACDSPSIWSTRNAVTIGAGSSTPPGIVDGPSVAYSTTDAYLTFATAAGVFVAHRVLATGTPSSYALQAGYATPDISTTPGSTELGDPDIHYLGSVTPGAGTWRIYVANRVTQGIARVEASEGSTLSFGAVTPVLAPSDLPAPTNVVALDGPSVAPSGTHGRADFVLAARARYVDGHTAIVLLRSDDGLAGWQWLNGSEASSTVTVPNGYADVAHDEVSGPSLVYRNGAWDLYYAGRTLGRAAIGLMLSDDLVHWRAAPSPVVVGPTGVPADFDAFSVRDPGVALVDRDEGRVELFYAGTDGVTTRLGRLERAATTIDASP